MPPGLSGEDAVEHPLRFDFAMAHYIDGKDDVEKSALSGGF